MRVYRWHIVVVVLAGLCISTACGPYPNEPGNQNDNLAAVDPNGVDNANANAAGEGDPVVETPTMVQLFDPQAVPQAGVSLEVGQAVSLQWDVGGLPDDAALIYVELATQQEVTISASASAGTAAWTIPASLGAGQEYEFRVASTDGTIYAASAAFTVTSTAPTGQDNDNSSAGPTNCTTNADCDDGVQCNGVEVCADGVCSNGTSTCSGSQTCNLETGQCESSPCQLDSDCAEGEACQDDICVDAPATADDLQSLAVDAVTGAAIDFGQALAVGSSMSLEAPDPILAAARLPSADCICSWSVDPATGGTFSDLAECSTDFLIAEAGTLVIGVQVTCGSIINTFSQRLTAVDTSCSDDVDCPESQSCWAGNCTDAPPPTPTITILEEATRVPFVVRFDMRLEDSDGQIIPAGVSAANFRVYEADAQIDLAETNMFVTPGENLPLQVMLVLDYTASMSAAGAIGPMVEAATDFVQAAHFTATHNIGVVEFHDRTDQGQGFSLAVPLTKLDTTGEAAIVADIPAKGDLEAGMSRAWDAVDLAIGTLNEIERQPGELRAIVFLSDGYDTTSEADALSLTTAAQGSDIRLYPIGFGDVSQNKPTLQLMADETGGTYFSASEATALASAFANIAFDLRGQWTLTYITQRNSGTVNARIEFEWDDSSVAYESSFDALAIAGDIHQGILSVLDRSYNPTSGLTEFTLKAEYLPRNVDRLRLQFAHSTASFALQNRGGLLDPTKGWAVEALGVGLFELSGPGPMEFGAFGNLGVVSVPGDVALLQVTHDDTVYAALPQPKTIAFEGDLWAAPYILTVSVDPPGSGSVTVAPYKSSYGHGELVNLVATSNAMVFDHWTGAGGGSAITLTMDGDKSVTAVFVAP